MKQRDLEETDDEQLDEDGEQCDNVSSKKAAKKRKRKQLKVRIIYIYILHLILSIHTYLFGLVD